MHAAARFRDRTSQRAAPGPADIINAQAPAPGAATGEVRIASLVFPAQARASAQVQVEPTIESTAQMDLVGGSNRCDPPGIFQSVGYGVSVVLLREGVEVARQAHCFPDADTVSGTPTWEPVLTSNMAPTDTNFTVQLREQDNDDVITERSFTITVPSDDGGDDSGGDVCPPGTYLDPVTGDCLRIEDDSDDDGSDDPFAFLDGILNMDSTTTQLGLLVLLVALISVR